MYIKLSLALTWLSTIAKIIQIKTKFSQNTGGEKYNEKLIGQVKSKEQADQLALWAKQTLLEEINLIYHKSNSE